jgi:hypothetical protein
MDRFYGAAPLSAASGGGSPALNSKETELEQVRSSLVSLRSAIGESLDRIASLLSRANGSPPPTGSGQSTSPAAVPSGTIGGINAELSSLADIASALNDRVNQLDRLV